MKTIRGYEVYWGGREWLFSDTNEPVITTWESRPCGHCNRPNTQEGHDGCIGRLPGVMNACCGHGDSGSAYYIQFPNGLVLNGFMARCVVLILKAFRWVTRR